MKHCSVKISVAMCAMLLLASSGTAQTRIASLGSKQATADHTSAVVFSKPVTITLKDVSLKRAVNRLAQQANVQIHYQAEMLEAVTRAVSLEVRNVSLGGALEQLLAGTPLEAIATDVNVVTIRGSMNHVMADGIIAGVVRHAETKQPIASAMVSIDDAKNGVATDDKGAFRISANTGKHVVRIRALGFVRTSRTITVEEGKTTTLEVVLEPSASVLDEVVVTGTVVATERKAIPNPITVITGEDLEKRGITRVEQLLRGEVPGVIALDEGTVGFGPWTPGAMASSKVYTRGSSTLSVGTGTNPLKTYVDGVEILDPSYLGTLDPNTIDRIEIVTGPQAATVYGSGAMGGVMQIFTKKGAVGRSEFLLSLRYGMLQNNISSGLTPTHNHTLTINGGGSPELTYSGNLSYRYQGAWQPFLFNRIFGASLGATHVRGSLTATASFSTTMGKNGTWTDNTYGILDAELSRTGVWAPAVWVRPSQRKAMSSSQTISFNGDYRVNGSWQHHVTIGRTNTDFDIIPSAPLYTRAAPISSDTMFTIRSSSGKRTTYGYNTTIIPPRLSVLSSTMTVGFTGTEGDRTQFYGQTASKVTQSLLNSSVDKALDERSYGGFGRAQIGLWDQFFFTAGIRGESNPYYGKEHRIDWTPTYGMTYTMDIGNLTMKLLTSYGRATRAPNPEQRIERRRIETQFLPATFLSQFANPYLTPEYSRGPQGGVELYYGSLATLTVNHYQQKVTDLIMYIVLDSLPGTRISTGEPVMFTQGMYINAATIRQQGYEATGSVNFGPFSAKGTYSWNDSRITQTHPLYSGLYDRRRTFAGVPTHTGNITVSYARGKTNAALVTNFIGRTETSGTHGPENARVAWGWQNRLKMYVERGNVFTSGYAAKAYSKSDLSVTHRISSNVSMLLNIVNLNDSYDGQARIFTPVLGRKTSFGLSFRY